MNSSPGEIGLEIAAVMEEAGLPRVVVSDGRLLDRNLNALGRDRVWLDGQLRQRGYETLSEIFLMLVDEKGGVYLAGKEEVT